MHANVDICVSYKTLPKPDIVQLTTHKIGFCGFISSIYGPISKRVVPLNSANFSMSDTIKKINFCNLKLYGIWDSPIWGPLQLGGQDP